MKFKIQLRKRSGETVHGIIRAEDRLQAIGLLTPLGHSLMVKCEEVSPAQACFFDPDFAEYLSQKSAGEKVIGVSEHDALVAVAEAARRITKAGIGIAERTALWKALQNLDGVRNQQSPTPS